MDRLIEVVFIVLTAANLFFMISIWSSFFFFLSMISPMSARTLPSLCGSAIYLGGQGAGLGDGHGAEGILELGPVLTVTMMSVGD